MKIFKPNLREVTNKPSGDLIIKFMNTEIGFHNGEKFFQLARLVPWCIFLILWVLIAYFFAKISPATPIKFMLLVTVMACGFGFAICSALLSPFMLNFATDKDMIKSYSGATKISWNPFLLCILILGLAGFLVGKFYFQI
jgi:hypothetical protein